MEVPGFVKARGNLCDNKRNRDENKTRWAERSSFSQVLVKLKRK